ncbi:unnamed protein product, partial [Cladocopium goreaui]
MEFSHGPVTLVVKYICPSPTVCPCHYRVSSILTDLTVVSMSVLLVVLACRVDSGHSLVRDGVRSLSLTHGNCPHDIVERYLLKISLGQWTRAVDLTGVQVVALGSLEVLLSDPVDASHLLVRSQFRSLGLTSGVLPTPECWNPNPYGMVCVVELLCGGCPGWAHVTRFLQCPELPAGHVDLGTWTEDFVKVPLPQATSDVLTILPPPPAPHAVPRGEYRKHRTAIISKGSVGHPLNCAAACKYVKRKGGCRDGADCPNCHECFWSKATAKESAERKEATPSAPGSQEDLVEKVVRLLQEESHQVPPKMAQAPEINFLGDYGPGFVDYLGVQIP